MFYLIPSSPPLCEMFFFCYIIFSYWPSYVHVCSHQLQLYVCYVSLHMVSKRASGLCNLAILTCEIPYIKLALEQLRQ